MTRQLTLWRETEREERAKRREARVSASIDNAKALWRELLGPLPKMTEILFWRRNGNLYGELRLLAAIQATAEHAKAQARAGQRITVREALALCEAHLAAGAGKKQAGAAIPGNAKRPPHGISLRDVAPASPRLQ